MQVVTNDFKVKSLDSENVLDIIIRSGVQFLHSEASEGEV